MLRKTIYPAHDGVMAAIGALLIAVLVCAFGGAAAAADDPAALVTAIYQRAAAGDGTEGGQFVWLEAKDRPRYLSKSLVALWARADARAQPGYAGPLDFDPITASQDPQVYSFTVTVERQEARRASVAATFVESKDPARPTVTVRYDLVRDGAAWKIDDIRGDARGAATECQGYAGRLSAQSGQRQHHQRRAGLQRAAELL